MSLSVSLIVQPHVQVDASELGGVLFRELKVGDYLYSNVQLAQVTKLTPKRAYVKVLKVLPYRQDVVHLPGSQPFSGTLGNFYVEDHGQRFVTLPDPETFDRLVAEGARHESALRHAMKMLHAVHVDRNLEIANIITGAKGLPAITHKEEE